MCGLEDVNYGGCRYTWSNKQDGDDRIYSKIDRVLANKAWLSMFANAEVNFMNEGLFDYSPEVLRIQPDVYWGKKLFRYTTTHEIQYSIPCLTLIV